MNYEIYHFRLFRILSLNMHQNRRQIQLLVYFDSITWRRSYICLWFSFVSVASECPERYRPPSCSPGSSRGISRGSLCRHQPFPVSGIVLVDQRQSRQSFSTIWSCWIFCKNCICQNGLKPAPGRSNYPDVSASKSNGLVRATRPCFGHFRQGLRPYLVFRCPYWRIRRLSLRRPQQMDRSYRIRWTIKTAYRPGFPGFPCGLAHSSKSFRRVGS